MSLKRLLVGLGGALLVAALVYYYKYNRVAPHSVSTPVSASPPQPTPLSKPTTRFTARLESISGPEQYFLRDHATGAYAHFSVTGANCRQLCLASPEGTTQSILLSSWSAPGIPVLFPFAGRIPNGEYAVAGKKYRFPVMGDQPVAMHGFVQGKNWKVLSSGNSDTSCALTFAVTSKDFSSMQKSYPFDWVLEATPELTTTGLTIRYRVTNTGTDPLPFSLGLHPWFRIPQSGQDGSRRFLVQVPASKTWNSAALESLTADNLQAGTNWTQDVPVELDLRSPGMPKKRGSILYTTLENKADSNVCRLVDHATGIQTILTMSLEFATVVLFRPGGNSTICLEPWTAPPNAFNAAHHNVPNNGLTILAPKETWNCYVHFSISKLSPHGA